MEEVRCLSRSTCRRPEWQEPREADSGGCLQGRAGGSAETNQESDSSEITQRMQGQGFVTDLMWSD